MDQHYTTIRLAGETKERLREYGEMGMSYDDVVCNLLDSVETLEHGTGER